ncbi:zinc-binding metallopeptidase [Pedobacter sp. MW01-1-1]|uniref:zinc-binding metallopeptidase n=1 Tax=Pedobacter sp. MW01-1-1 TaxID=3383027 RepID=UPI003FEE389F
MKKIYLIMLGFLIGMSGCKKEENLDREITGLGGDTWPQIELDKWLYTNFIAPYNILVKYRWDGTEYDNAKTLTPVKVEKVQPLMEVIKGSWIDPYVEEAGIDFIKKYAPKNYVLVGSLDYNSSGTVKLGEAEGGVKVTLFGVNNFEKSNRTNTVRILQTIHHEFGHILHQNVAYPNEFQLITPAGYTSDWNNKNNYAENGFITKYSQSNPNDDFVEMIAVMLTEGQPGYEALLKSNPSETAVKLIRQKEEIVVTYYKQVWGIDFYALQNKVQKSLDDLSPRNLLNYFGFDKAYTSITINPETTAGLSAEFLTQYEAAKKAMFEYSNSNKYVLDNMVLKYSSDKQMDIIFNYHASAGTNQGKTYDAIYEHSFVEKGNEIKYTETGKNTNAQNLAKSLAPLTSFFTQTPMIARFFFSSDLKMEYGGFVKATDTASYTFGTLGN